MAAGGRGRVATAGDLKWQECGWEMNEIGMVHGFFVIKTR
jgi:hypothetical protein